MLNRQIGVIGGRDADEDLLNAAEEVGRQIARAGAILFCGGLGGVMEAACRGAKGAQGLTVGILPMDDESYVNPYVDVVIPSGLGIARNAVIINCCHGVIAVDGSYGTLSEMAFACQRKVPMVSLKSWSFDESILCAETPEEAVEMLFSLIKK